MARVRSGRDRGTHTRSLLAAFLAAAVAGCGGDGPTDPGGDEGGEGPEPLPGTWSTAAALPLGLADAAVTVHQGRIYVMGGRPSDTTATARSYRFDPATNQWERLADLDEPRMWGAAGVHDGRVMLMGGNGAANTVALNPRSAVHALEDGAWALHSALPTLSLAPKAVSRDGGLWVIETGSMPSPPRGSAFLAAGATEWIALEGGLPPISAEYFLGDGDRAWAVNFENVSDFRDGAWSEPYALPDGFLVGAWAADGRLYVLTREATRPSMRVRDAATGTWEPLAAPTEGFQRSDAMTVTLDGKLYLLGGREATPAGRMMTRVDVFTPPS